MLSKADRLPSPRMREVMHRGKRFSYESLTLVVSQNNLNVSRFGFIAGTRMDKRATVRNRIKRLLREAVRLNISTILPGRDVVVTAKRQIEPPTFAGAEKMIKEIFQRAGLWKTS